VSPWHRRNSPLKLRAAWTSASLLVAFTVAASFAKPAEDGTRAFSGVAYGGGVITDHPWLDRVAFDLASTTFDTPLPRSVRTIVIRWASSRPGINGNITHRRPSATDIRPGAADRADGRSRGMPWQMSVGHHPRRGRRDQAGREGKLNGQTFDGPLTVFRQNRIRETFRSAPSAPTTARARKSSPSAASAALPLEDQMDQAEHDVHDAAIAKGRADRHATQGERRPSCRRSSARSARPTCSISSPPPARRSRTTPSAIPR
jgi:hypothetical protein